MRSKKEIDLTILHLLSADVHSFYSADSRMIFSFTSVPVYWF